MIRCKWCLNSYEKLAKAHIIPEAFIRNYAGNRGRVYTVDSFSKSSKTGWYDNTINCVSCEKEFQSIDDRAIKILLRDFDQIQVPGRLLKVCQISKEYTQDLKRFFIYTLWKCSVSSLPEFKEINLGPYEDIIKSALIDNKCFTDDEFSFVAQYHVKPVGFSLPFKRHRRDFEGRVYYHLDLNKFGIDVKIDKQPTPGLWNLFAKFNYITFLRFNTPPNNKIEGMRKILYANAAFEKSVKERRGKV